MEGEDGDCDGDVAVGAERALLADRLGLGVLIQSLHCLNMLWEAKKSGALASDSGTTEVAAKLQPLVTQVAAQLLALVRDFEEEAVLARPEYAEGFGATCYVLLALAEMRQRLGQPGASVTLQLTAFHCALATERFTNAFLGAMPLASNLRAACACARSDPATAKEAYCAAIDAVGSMDVIRAVGSMDGADKGRGSPAPQESSPFAVEIARAETGLAELEHAGGNGYKARKMLEGAASKFGEVGAMVLQGEAIKMRDGIVDY